MLRSRSNANDIESNQGHHDDYQDVTRKSRRRFPSFFLTILFLTAVAIPTWVLMRNKIAMVLRSKSDSVRNTDHVDDRGTELGDPVPINWTDLHLQEKGKTEKDLVVLKRKLGSRFISLKDNDEILSYEELEEQYRPLLQERGLVVMGDSTSRIIFGTLWCLIEGIFRYGDQHVCEARLKELKTRCQASMADGKVCEVMATFTNETTPIHLQFQHNWDIGKADGDLQSAMADNRDRFIFYILPCLHALWMPGGRENYIRTQYPSWNTSFHDFYTSMEQANPAHSLFLATSVTLCDSKLWEKPLIDFYLQGKAALNGEPKSILKLYEYSGMTGQPVTLPANFSGPLPLVNSFRENHTCDNALFDEAGNLKCIAVGLEVLMQHSLMDNPAVKVLDMHGATAFRCEDTFDGRHYSRGLTLRRELTLLLRAMQSAPNSKAVRNIDHVDDRRTELGDPVPINWTDLHLQEKGKTEKDLVVLKRKLGSRFLSLKDNDEILSYQELEEQYRPLLQERGLVVMGDSTSRIIFGTLWCLIEGIFRSGDQHVCEARLKELKTRCQASMADGKVCEVMATFTNETTPIHLQFQHNWVIGKADGNLQSVMADNRDRFIFYILPCLHALWMPGGRENYIRTQYPSWNTSFHDFYTSMEKANPAHSLFLATSVTLCDSKLWEKPLIDFYLQGKAALNGEPKSILKLYEYSGMTGQPVTLPANFSGPLPLVNSFRENHTCDNALFDEAGNLKCIAVGLEVLMQHSLMDNPAVKVLDMHGATAFRCEDTYDGRHYSRGLTLRRELTLLLRAMQRAPKP